MVHRTRDPWHDTFGSLRAMLAKPADATRCAAVMGLVREAMTQDRARFEDQWSPYLAGALSRDDEFTGKLVTWCFGVFEEQDPVTRDAVLRVLELLEACSTGSWAEIYALSPVLEDTADTLAERGRGVFGERFVDVVDWSFRPFMLVRGVVSFSEQWRARCRARAIVDTREEPDEPDTRSAMLTRAWFSHSGMLWLDATHRRWAWLPCSKVWRHKLIMHLRQQRNIKALLASMDPGALTMAPRRTWGEVRYHDTDSGDFG
ncbi:MAG: hypothetical protein AAGI01_11745 [Myxococcota bacterium]